MQRPKLSEKQIKAIEEALDNFNGDAELFLEAHKIRLNTGLKWKRQPILNTLSAEELEYAIRFGFDIVEKHTEGSVVRVVNIVKKLEQYKQALELDLDYWLASLYDAMQRGDQGEIVECKKRLTKIQNLASKHLKQNVEE